MQYIMVAVQKTLINWISDLLWPHLCLGCKMRGNPLCLDCMRAIPAQPAVHQFGHGVEVASGAALAEPLLSSAVWHLKYRNMSSLAAPLALWLAGAMVWTPRIRELLTPTPLLVPVPLHALRLRERGYNQAELLGRSLAGIAALTFAPDALIRTRHTHSQVVSAKRVERIANMAGAFSCVRPDLVRGRSVLLVDDVCTTGATLAACAQALKASGACTVAAVVLARA